MKKSISIMCAIVLALTTMAGCASKGGSTQTAGNEKKEKAVVTVIQNKVEIQEQLEAAAKDFNKTHDDAEIQILGSAGDNLVATLQSQFASDPAKAPTLFTCGSGSEFEKFFNYMAPVDDTAASQKIVEGQKTPSMKDGKLYGLPTAIEGFGLVYNKDLFEKAGVKPEDIKSMDDLVSACGKLEKVQGVSKALAFSQETYFKFMHPFNWPFAVKNDYEQVIQDVSSGKTKLKDVPEVKQYVQDLDKLKSHTNLGKDTYDEQVAGFAQGKYAMIHQGEWVQSVLDQYKISFKYGMMPVPFNGNDKLAVGNSNYWRVNKNATEAQQKGAKEFLDWLYTDKAGQTYVTDKFKLIPAYTGFDTKNMEPLLQEVAKYSQEGKTIPWTFKLFPAGVDKDCASAMEKFYAGQINTDQLLDEINKVWTDAATK